MIPVELSKIIIDERNADQVVVLKEKGGQRKLPIVIGFLEASSIQMHIAGIEPPRPLTHDLLATVIESLGAEAEQLLIENLIDGTFYAKLRLRNANGDQVVVDCRPSDGIALAVRSGIPILAAEKLLSH